MTLTIQVPVEAPNARSRVMSRDEARRVSWFHSDPRPIGELLDLGVITRRDLRWAAEKSFVPAIKEAAAVLLSANDATPSAAVASPLPATSAGSHSVPIPPMGLDEARRVAWPFRPDRGEPMGQLFDNGTLTTRELGRALDTAWDPSVRKAAATLLLQRLVDRVREPEPPSDPLRVITGKARTFTEHRERQYTLGLGLFLGVWMTIAVGYLITRVPSLGRIVPTPEVLALFSTPAGVIGGAIAITIAIAAMVLTLLTTFGLLTWSVDFFEKRIQAYREGHEGENRVVDGRATCWTASGRSCATSRCRVDSAATSMRSLWDRQASGCSRSSRTQAFIATRAITGSTWPGNTGTRTANHPGNRRSTTHSG